MKQGARSDVDNHNLVCLLEKPVGHGLTDAQPGKLPDLIAQAGQVLHVHGGENVDARLEQHLNVLPALLPFRAGSV